jgi:Tol biopolymer transport system component
MRARSFTLWYAVFAIVFLAGCAGAQSTVSPDPVGTTTAAAPATATVIPLTASVPAAVPQKSAVAATALPLPTIVIPTPLPPAAKASATQAASPAQPAGTTTVVATAAPAPETVESLHGQILFRTDRSGGYTQLYVMNPDGSDQRPCDCSAVLEAMVKREVTSPDGQLFLFIKNVGGSLRAPTDQQIWSHNNRNGYEALVTGEAPGFPGVDYAPVWSPNARYIAWVSETDGNDEIYVRDTVTGENKRLSDNDKAWDKHPSFSPDGSQLVFWSNRESAVRKQIWLVNLDGSQAHNISQNSYNDTDPIWVK